MGTKKIYTNLFVKGEFTNGNITYPQVDGTSGQVMVTDGGGTLTWQTVSGGTGSGSTSPGGNDGDIQFNNLGTFGGDGNFNWDYGNGNLYFEGGDGQSSTLNVGQLDNSVLGGTGVTRGTSLVYNNSLSGLSANTVFLVGDTGEFLGDNTMITGYLDVNNVSNILMTNPYITQLVASSDGYNTNISMQSSSGIDLQTSDSGGTQTARVTMDPTRGVSNFISDGNNFNVSTDSNTPLTITSAITINNEYTLPNFDGTNSQVMTTNGSGVITWETVSGSTSPAGSNTQIQFNDSGSFGANTGFTFDTTSQTLFTESNVSGSSVNFYNGLSNFDVGFGPSEVIGTTTIYNTDPIGSASGLTMFTMGDLTDVFGTDNTYLLGFINTAGNTNSFINGSPEGTQIIYTPPDGGGGNNNIEVGYGGITNVILSGKTFEVQGVSNTLLNVNNTGTTFHSTYTFPTTDGSLGQVLQTNGGGSVSWATVSGGTGSGSTLPAGSSSEIQFNDNGAFGSDSGFTRGVSGESFSVTSTIGTKFFAQAQGDLTAFGLPTEAVGSVYGDDDNTLGIISGDLSGLGLTGIGSVLIAGDETSGDTGLIVVKSSQAGIFYDNATSSGGVNLSNDTVGVNLTDNATFNTGLQLTPSVTDVVFENSNGKSEVTLEETGVILKAEDLIVTGGTSGSTEFIVKPVTIQMVNIPAYNDDTAAGVGGLVTGEMFQTTGSGAAPLNAAGILMIKQ